MQHNIKVGDILSGCYHYSMTIPHFYQVIKVTDKRLKVVRMDSRMVKSVDRYNQQGWEMPINAHLDGKTLLARPYKDEWLIGSSYDMIFVHKWDGQPVWADYCD